MPLFKPKTNKALIVDSQKSVTLDNKHNEIVETFQEQEEIDIPKINEKIKTLKKVIKHKKISLTTKLEIEDKIKDLKREREELKEKKKEYFLENSSLIFDYFETKKILPMNRHKQKY